MFLIETAHKIVDEILERVNENPKLDFSFKIYLFGSIFYYGHGNDIDIIVEVPIEVFEEYKARCLVLHDGIIPYSKRLVADYHSLYWSYFSPAQTRSEEALRTICVELDSMACFTKGSVFLDISCLPVGWDKIDSEIFSALNKEFRGTIDPDFLINACATSKQIFPKK